MSRNLVIQLGCFPHFSHTRRRLRSTLILLVCLLGGETLSADSAREQAPESPVPELKAPPPLTEEILRTRPEAPPPPKNLPSREEMQERLRLLEQFLGQPPEKLALMRRTIESIEKMSEAERKQLHERLQKYFRMQPEDRNSLATRMARFTASERARLRERWVSLSPEERRAERALLSTLKPHERMEHDRAILERLATSDVRAKDPPDIELMDPPTETEVEEELRTEAEPRNDPVAEDGSRPD